MRLDTKKRKESIKGFERILERETIKDQMFEIFKKGKEGLDLFLKDLGVMMAETIMYIEREEIAGPDYHPHSSDVRKWSSQKGSIYLGDQKVRLEHPRLRGLEGEIQLKSYQQLRNRNIFSEELLNKVLRGLSAQKYKETVLETANTLGVS